MVGGCAVWLRFVIKTDSTSEEFVCRFLCWSWFQHDKLHHLVDENAPIETAYHNKVKYLLDLSNLAAKLIHTLVSVSFTHIHNTNRSPCCMWAWNDHKWINQQTHSTANCLFSLALLENHFCFISLSCEHNDIIDLWSHCTCHELKTAASFHGTVLFVCVLVWFHFYFFFVFTVRTQRTQKFSHLIYTARVCLWEWLRDKVSKSWVT